MKVDLGAAELHNLVKRRGGLEVRPGLMSIHEPTAGTLFVSSWSIESPFTGEVWHYLVEQSTTTSIATLRVFTEEFYELYSYSLGVLPQKPVVRHGVANNQVQVNSPSLSAPLYGLVGGGLITAVKTESVNPDTTALEIPTGHVAVFGDRLPVAQGNLLLFNDPGIDPRTYTAQNVLPLGGTIHDHFQAGDGALYAFTTAGAYFIPADALGRGQEVQGFVGLIPGIQTSRPRNAAASNGVVVALQRGGLAVLGEGQAVIDVAPYKGPRYFSESVEVDDYRLAAEVFPSSEGFLVGFRGRRGFILDFDLRDGYRSYIWHQTADLNLVGTLRSRDGDTLLVLEDRVVQKLGTRDFGDVGVRGVACQEVDIPEATEALVRHITTSSDNVGQTVGVYTRGQALTKTVPTKADDTIIGTSTWAAARKYRSRQPRTVRHSMAERATHLPLEVVVEGGCRRLETSIDVEFRGQGRKRRDKR